MIFTHFSLFAGIGGLDLAAEWAGFDTVGQVEYADHQTKILEKHWPGVPRWRDIRDVTIDAVRGAGITQSPTVLSGGFPCQPFSCAGKRRGKKDDRYLWPEMLRVVQELRPAWVVGENVAGLVNLGLDQVLSDLESAGYSCRAFLFPAAGVGAPHRRDRVFIVAHTSNLRYSGRADRGSERERDALSGESRQVTDIRGESLRRRGDVAHAPVERFQERDLAPGSGEAGFPPWRADPFGGLWLSEPDVGRVADGIPARVDRLRALGNAVVPQQAYPIFKAIYDVEMAAREAQEGVV